MTGRGCGSRVEDGLYVCVPMSPFGKPIDYFLIDPAIPFVMPSDVNFRAPYLHKDPQGVNHLVLGVGNSFYPFVSDFVEEARVMGISKRLSRNFDYRSLDPQRSNLILIHKRAIPDFSYHINREDYYNCPRLKSGRFDGDAVKFPADHLVDVTRNGRTVKMVGHPCLGDTWALGSYLNVPEKHVLSEASDGLVTVETPSAKYTVDPAFTMKGGARLTRDNVNEDTWRVGAFLRFPKFHFEYVAKKGHESDEEKAEYETQLEKLQEIYADRGFGFKIMEE